MNYGTVSALSIRQYIYDMVREKRRIRAEMSWQSRLTLCKEHCIQCLNTLFPSVRFWLWPVMSGFLWIPPWGWCLRSATSALPPPLLFQEQVLLSLHYEYFNSKTFPGFPLFYLIVIFLSACLHSLTLIHQSLKISFLISHKYFLHHLYTSSHQM